MPYVHLACPASKQLCPKRAACGFPGGASSSGCAALHLSPSTLHHESFANIITRPHKAVRFFHSTLGPNPRLGNMIQLSPEGRYQCSPPRRASCCLSWQPDRVRLRHPTATRPEHKHCPPHGNAVGDDDLLILLEGAHKVAEGGGTPLAHKIAGGTRKRREIPAGLRESPLCEPR